MTSAMSNTPDPVLRTWMMVAAADDTSHPAVAQGGRLKASGGKPMGYAAVSAGASRPAEAQDLGAEGLDGAFRFSSSAQIRRECAASRKSHCAVRCGVGC